MKSALNMQKHTNMQRNRTILSKNMQIKTKGNKTTRVDFLKKEIVKFRPKNGTSFQINTSVFNVNP